MFRDAEVAMADMYAGKCSDNLAKELDAAFWDELTGRIQNDREVCGGERGAGETHGSEEEGSGEEVRGRPWSGVDHRLRAVKAVEDKKRRRPLPPPRSHPFPLTLAPRFTLSRFLALPSTFIATAPSPPSLAFFLPDSVHAAVLEV